MSLLLDALKKAEKAKQEAQRNAKSSGGSGDAPPAALSLAPDDEPRRVVTRDELPDITRPMDIHTDDLNPARTAEPMFAEPRQASPGQNRKAAPAAAPVEPQASDRAAAKKVFEAKYREPNPRMPFYITMALLGIAVVGTGVYFWSQMRPPPPLVNPNPPPRDTEAVPVPPAGNAAVPAKAEETAAPVIPGLPQAPAAAATAPASPAVPLGKPGTSAPVAAPAAAGSAKAPVASTKGTAGAAAPGQVLAGAAPAPNTPAITTSPPKPTVRARPSGAPGRAQAADEAGAINSSRPVASVHPRVEAGYAAYLNGDLAAARDNYQIALQEDPNNRDALLGMAATETSAQRFELAENHYRRLLQADPRDAYAQAGIIALRGPLIDPVAAESRLKSLLAADPEAALLNFTLGNQLAQQDRWAEAQQAYFRAYTADPDNPDVSYNLGVSLDHLRQPALALQYYRRALTLSEKRPAGFSQLAARNRIADLER